MHHHDHNDDHNDDNTHHQHRQSSLPSSLIPHLFSRPQHPTDFPFTPLPYLSSTPHHRVSDPPPSSSFSQLYPSPIYSDPRFHAATHSSASSPSSSSSRPQTYSLPPLNPSSWREGEPGPSSLVRPVSYHHRAPFSTLARGSIQPLRVDSRASGAYRSPSPIFEPVQAQLRHRGEGDAYFSSSDHSWPGDYRSLRGSGPSRSPENRSPSYEESQDRQGSYTFPAVGSLSISAPSSSYVRGRSSDAGSEVHRSDARSAEVGSNDDGEGSQKGKRRREESVETDDNAKKSRNARKTAVAWRKLRCNGEKPSCYNCTVRKFECEYVPVQRRRGPGKAPKGSRTKKGGRTESRGAGDRTSAALAEHELDSLAPEVRPYMSVLTLDNFEFQAPERSPSYPDIS